MNAACLIEIEDQQLEIRRDEKLVEACDRGDLPVGFSCRGGACGVCMIEVLEGGENLSPLSGNERVLLPELSRQPDSCRLACQVSVHGPLRFRWLDENDPLRNV